MRIRSAYSALTFVLLTICAHVVRAEHITSTTTCPDKAANSPGYIRRPDLWASVDLLYWKPQQRGLDFAATEDGSALTIGSGRLHDVDLDRDLGVRTRLGAVASNGWGIDVGYTYFESEGRNEVNRPAGTGQLFSTFSHPGGPEEADSAVGEAGIDYHSFDLLARHCVLCKRHASVDLFGGLRFANIDQEIVGRFNGRDFTNGVVRHRSDVNAFGFQFGGTAFLRGNYGLSLFGSAAASAMRGSIDNHRYETNFDGAQILVDLRDDYTQPVFNFETALGINLRRDDWTLTAGYEFNIWTNLGDRLRFVDDIEEASLTAIPGDLLLEGFFARLVKAW